MRKPITLLASAIVCIAPLLPAVAEVDLFDIQAAVLLGETTVKVPAEAKEVDLPAIASCIKGAKGITLDLSATKIKVISDSAFSGCTALKEVILPSTLTSIEDEVFWWCESLTSITIPSSVTSIGDSAFWGCTSLSSITFARTGGWYLDEALTQSVGSGELSSYLEAGKALYMRCD